jgi:predicted nucleotide-binding protein
MAHGRRISPDDVDRILIFETGSEIAVTEDRGRTWHVAAERGTERTDDLLVDAPRDAQGESKPEVTGDRVSVFVVHGRDLRRRMALFELLRAMGLRPLEWEVVVGYTGNPSSTTLEIVREGFRRGHATVVLMTPDDEARVKDEFLVAGEASESPRGQARPNVLFEAGLALALHRLQTVIIEVGALRGLSDLAGLNTVHVGSPNWRHVLAQRLATAGCEMELGGTDWLSAGEGLEVEDAPLPVDSAAPAGQPHLILSIEASAGAYRIVVANDGPVALRDLRVELDDAPNWHVLGDSTADELPVGQNVELPVVVMLGGPSAVNVTVTAVAFGGEEYRKRQVLRIN